MQNTHSPTHANLDRLSIDAQRIVDTLDPDVISDISRRAVIGEIVNFVTGLSVTYSESELAGPADSDIEYTDSGVLIQRDAVQLWSRDGLSASMIEPDVVFPLAEASPSVNHDHYEVITVNGSFIYETVDITVGDGDGQ